LIASSFLLPFVRPLFSVSLGAVSKLAINQVRLCWPFPLGPAPPHIFPFLILCWFI
jgi:hypothetical protein